MSEAALVRGGREPVITYIEAYLEARRQELIEFAAELVATPSPNPPGDEEQMAAVVSGRLRELGVGDVTIAEAAPGRHNVLATVAGKAAKPILILNGHLDTKPPDDNNNASWNTPPYKPVLQDGTLTGLGAADMKGAVAAITYAAGAVAGASLNGTLRLVFTADEEAGGNYGSRWLAEHAMLAGDACVIGEPSGIHAEWDAIRLVSRGVAIFRISVRGTQMHSSLSDEFEGVNASLAMAQLMVRMARKGPSMFRFRLHPLSDRGPTFNVGLVARGGSGYGIHPGDAEFLCDVRALPGMMSSQIERDVRAFLAAAEKEDPTLHTEFELLNWTPPAEISADHPIVRAVQDASELVLGASPPLGMFPGGTDAPYFSDVARIPTVPAFGPGLLTSAHTPNEHIATASIVNAARMYAIAAVNFLGH